MSNPLALENAKLRERVERQAELIAYFEGVFAGLGDELPREWGLTRQEARTAGLILHADGRVVTFEAIIIALWEDREPESARTQVPIVIFRVRRKLGPFGVRIKNVFGVGYRVEGAAR